MLVITATAVGGYVAPPPEVVSDQLGEIVEIPKELLC
jgi:hypothetical protein